MFYLDFETGKNAIYGGWFFGGGGGGMPKGGLDVLESALTSGKIKVSAMDEFKPEDIIVTASLVGSPSTGKDAVTTEHCRRVYSLFIDSYKSPINGIISNETGAHSITNGWIAAAVNGLPIVDGACNGRAHPTGVMGAMGLDSKPGYQTLQVAVGGTGSNDLVMSARGSIASTSKLVREASTLSGGFITVLRNPIDAAYVKENSAAGALTVCAKIGELFLRNEHKPDKLLDGLHEKLNCQVLCRGTTEDFYLTAKGGFDSGSVKVRDGKKQVEVTFWNEYMTVEEDSERLATFPDLIALLDAKSGMPLCSAQVKNGLEVILVCVPRANLLLSSTMFDKNLFKPCEEAIGKALIPYAFP